ncbi:MAG: nucleotide exchange factor GrpE [Myxococcales bacterium]|nr:nucleotide exchange factor GrpE [Myxococcales bacterium]MCB9707417.1 nucleotide exchange factor GrpE [Myxococcales bacterium]
MTESQPPDSETYANPADAEDDTARADHEMPSQAVDLESSRGDRTTAMDDLTLERDKIKDQLLRVAADFDNFRKRTRRDMENAALKGKEEALLELLPVIDNLERAVQAAHDTHDIKSLLEGIHMVLRLFEDGAKRLGIKRLSTVGKSFDPNVHEALQQQPTADHPPGTIVAEVQPGYVLGTRVLRAALVVVAKPVDPPGGASERPREPSVPPPEDASMKDDVNEPA